MRAVAVVGADWSAEEDGDLLVVSPEEFERAVRAVAASPPQAPLSAAPAGQPGRRRKPRPGAG